MPPGDVRSLTFAHDGDRLRRRIGESRIVRIGMDDGLYDGLVDQGEEVSNVCRDVRRRCD